VLPSPSQLQLELQEAQSSQSAAEATRKQREEHAALMAQVQGTSILTWLSMILSYDSDPVEYIYAQSAKELEESMRSLQAAFGLKPAPSPRTGMRRLII